MEERKIQIYCNVDENGEILDAYSGENIIPGGPYNFFFWETVEVAENITGYKVAMNGMRAELVLKDAG